MCLNILNYNIQYVLFQPLFAVCVRTFSRKHSHRHQLNPSFKKSTRTVSSFSLGFAHRKDCKELSGRLSFFANCCKKALGQEVSLDLPKWLGPAIGANAQKLYSGVHQVHTT